MTEQHAPQQITPQSLGDYLEVMSKAVFQSGMSWRVVEAKWLGTRAAFHNFDADTVAGFSEHDIDTLATDTRVIRNYRKLAAVVGNAIRMKELEQKHGSFQNYLRAHVDYDATVASLRKEFKFLGEMGCYYFLYVVGEKVPPYEEWHAARQR